MVCFNTKFFVLFIIAIVIASFYYDYKRHLEIKAVHEGYQDIISKKCPPCQCANSQPEIDNGNVNTAYNPQQIDVNINEINQMPPIGMPMPPRMPHHGMPPVVPVRNIARQYDMANMYDPLVQPGHRESLNVLGPDLLIPQYVGRSYDTPSLKGVAVAIEGDPTIKANVVEIIGRERYSAGSGQWTYYGLIKTNSGITKATAHRKDNGRGEIYDGDELVIDVYGDKVFKFKENKHNMMDRD